MIQTENSAPTVMGTAGIWRASCIEDAGGWQWDPLTEDLDLSYRAQMRGWKIDYLPDVVVPAELPPQVEAYKNQQFRWAKGSFQVVRKILPKLFEGTKLPLHVRLLALLHITGYGVHPLMLAILLLTRPVGLYAPHAFELFPISIIAGFGPPLVYLSAKAPHTPSLAEGIRLLPLMTITGFGLCLNTTVAVLAVQGTKRTLNLWAKRGLADALKFEAMSTSTCFVSDDLLEGYAAARERRGPRFEGK